MLHNVSPQTKLRAKKLYLCSDSTSAFVSASHPRCGLLIGTMSTERAPKKPVTSISGPQETPKPIPVVKVAAIYNGVSNSTALHNLLSDLNMRPVGYIFSTNASTPECPVPPSEVYNSCKLQSCNMEAYGKDKGDYFVTVAVDSSTGAAEAFQMSDQFVQMSHDNILKEPTNSSSTTFETNEPVIIAGSEVRSVDAVLALVNTPVLQHDGAYPTTTSSPKLNKKTRRALSAMAEASDSKALLSALLDFHVLLHVYRKLESADATALVKVVSKYKLAKKSTVLSKKVMKAIQKALC